MKKFTGKWKHLLGTESCQYCTEEEIKKEIQEFESLNPYHNIPLDYLRAEAKNEIIKRKVQ